MKCGILKRFVMALFILLVFSSLIQFYLAEGNSIIFLSEKKNNQTSEKNVEMAVVSGHISGSIIKVEMEDGSECSVQIAGAFTPLSGKEFDASYKYALEMLPVGRMVFLERAFNFLESKDSEYRIRYIWLDEPSNNPKINEIRNNLYDAGIVADGFGYSIPSWYDSYYNNYIEELGKYASKNKLGLWGM